MGEVAGQGRIVGPSEVLKLIERWRSLDLPRMRNGEIDHALRELMDGLCFVESSTREICGTQTIYRARFKRRRNENNDKDWPWRATQALFHPVGPDVPLGRCNVEGIPALYCADLFNTALREIGAEDGDEIVLIEYDVVNARLARIVGPFNPTATDSGEPILEGDELVSYQIVRDFIRSEFTKPVGTETRHLYRVSAAICREWFNGSLDGWIYPSVESPAHECIALRGSSVATRIAIRKATLVRVFAVQDRCFAVEALKRSVHHDGGRVGWLPGTGHRQWICDAPHHVHGVPVPARCSRLLDWIRARL